MRFVQHSIGCFGLTSLPVRGFNGAMRRTMTVVSAIALVVYLAAASWLGQLESGGPAHEDVFLAGDIPGTLFLPESPEGKLAFLDSLPPEERPPAVLLVHGFASDRLGLSGLARKLAGAGYAALTIDVQGHGQNRSPFRGSRATDESFFSDLSAAVDYLRATKHVDGSRIVVMGHSMGAGAVLDYATRDSGIDGAVMISGGWRLDGPYRPPNALFIFASRDPDFIRGRSRKLAARILGRSGIELSQTYGDPSRGTAVRVVEVSGTDHMNIVWNDAAAREIVAWLDGIFGDGRSEERVSGDPRMLAALLVALAALFTLPGLGQVVGRLVPHVPEMPGSNPIGSLAILALALAATLPLLAVGPPGALLSTEVGDVVVSHLSLCGIAVLVFLAFTRRLPAGVFAVNPLPTILGSAVAIIAVFVLIVPAGVVVHRLTLTPERTTVFVLAALALLPFTIAFQLLLRRGRPVVAAIGSLCGRAIVLGTLVAGALLGVVPGVVMLMLPPFALAFAAIELLADSVYAASRNLAAIALIDAGWLALIVAATMPIRV
jgi:dienelactone hydrolase